MNYDLKILILCYKNNLHCNSNVVIKTILRSLKYVMKENKYNLDIGNQTTSKLA